MAATLAALVLAPGAYAGDIDEDGLRYRPAPILSWLAGVEVRCYKDWPYADITGFYRVDPLRIGLAPRVCVRLRETLNGRPGIVGYQADAWHTFAHEVAHTRGYDHGQETIGADCAGYHLFMRPLLRKAGIPADLARRLMGDARYLAACPTGWQAYASVTTTAI